MLAPLLAVALAAAPTPPPAPTRMLAGVPDVMQANNYSCGVGAVQAVAQYYGVWGYHDKHVGPLGTTPEQGTHPVKMATYLRTLGLDAQVVEGLTPAALRSYVDRGVPVIVDYQAWNEDPKTDYRRAWEDGHYSIVVGYGKGTFFLEDPSLLGTTGWLSEPELLARWHDYEIEGGKRHAYVHMGIVVKGRAKPPGRFTHVD